MWWIHSTFFFLWLKISHHVKREIFCVVSSSVAIQMHQSFEHPFLCASLCFERGWMKTNNRICSAVKHPSPHPLQSPNPVAAKKFVVFSTWKSLQSKVLCFPSSTFKNILFTPFIVVCLPLPYLFIHSFILSCSFFIIVVCMWNMYLRKLISSDVERIWWIMVEDVRMDHVFGRR